MHADAACLRHAYALTSAGAFDTAGASTFVAAVLTTGVFLLTAFFAAGDFAVTAFFVAAFLATTPLLPAALGLLPLLTAPAVATTGRYGFLRPFI